MPHLPPTQINASYPHQGGLLRKRQLLALVSFSKSTLHAKLNVNSPYHDPTFPRPIFFPKCRLPFWRRESIEGWINEAESGDARRR